MKNATRLKQRSLDAMGGDEEVEERTQEEMRRHTDLFVTLLAREDEARASHRRP